MKKELLLIAQIFFISILCVSAQTKENIHYGPNAQQTLDYYKAPKANSPVIIVVHGGSWRSQDKSDPEYKNVSTLFNNAGYAVVNIDYRLDTAADYHGYPEQPDDLACAIVWTKLNVKKFNGDSSKIVLYGHSAGSHLVNLHGLNYNDNSLLFRCRNTAPLNVKAVMSTSSVLDFDAINPARYPDINAMLVDSAKYWKVAQPINHVSAQVPTKFLVLMGQADTYLGLQEAYNFYDSMVAHHHCIALKVFCGYNHKTILTKLSATDTVFRTMIHFLESLGSTKNCSDSVTIPCENFSNRTIMPGEVSSISDLLIYPNPVQDNLNFQFTAKRTGKANIKIYNFTGEEVISTGRFSVAGLNKFNLNTSKLVKGIYIFEIENNSGIQRQKFTVSK